KKKCGLKIAVVGCVAQLEGEELFKLQPHIDYILGPDNYLEKRRGKWLCDAAFRNCPRRCNSNSYP
ncbi:MAG: hypothetical protein ABIK93_04870, partial [candidate division WOR-3 bacterium]